MITYHNAVKAVFIEHTDSCLAVFLCGPDREEAIAAICRTGKGSVSLKVNLTKGPQEPVNRIKAATE